MPQDAPPPLHEQRQVADDVEFIVRFGYTNNSTLEEIAGTAFSGPCQNAIQQTHCDRHAPFGKVPKKEWKRIPALHRQNRHYTDIRRVTMTNIKPVSDLRNYAKVLRDITVGEPVFLTKSGRGKYVLLDMEEYDKTQATMKLMADLARGRKAGEDLGWQSIDEVEAALGIA